VKADLSDLKDQIEWCRVHDAECEIIAENAKRLYAKYISKDGILDYMQMVFYEIAERTMQKPPWARQQEMPLAPFSLSRPGDDLMNYCCRVGGETKLCVTCTEKKKVGVKRKLEEKEQEDPAIAEKLEKQNKNRERMRKLAHSK
jgi:hypothetical protein